MTHDDRMNIAARAGVCLNTVKSWEAGKPTRRATKKVIEQAAKDLGIDINGVPTNEAQSAA